jgi:hypothetical protein
MVEWGRLWRMSTKGRSLAALDTRPPSAAFCRHILTLPQRHATLLSQLRLDFSDLGATEHLLLDSPERLWDMCGAEETRVHFLLVCGGYREARRRLFEEVKKAGGRLEGASNQKHSVGSSTHALPIPSFVSYTLPVVFAPFLHLLFPLPRPKRP